MEIFFGMIVSLVALFFAPWIFQGIVDSWDDWKVDPKGMKEREIVKANKRYEKQKCLFCDKTVRGNAAMALHKKIHKS